MIDAGVPVTLATDNPSMFGVTLTGEYLALAREQAFGAGELAALVRNGVEASFLPAEEKAALRAEVEAGLARAAREAGVDVGA
jgi:aminodeoxyfutalosine deaminase